MKIDYTKLSIEELERLYFLHIDAFDFICDGDKKKIIMKRIED